MKSFLPAAFCARNVFALSALLALLALPLRASAQTSLARISVDNLANSDSDHKTEVEPDMFAWGNTIVTAFHVARRPGSIGWGSGDVGFSTSIDGGKTWHYGDLPGLTVNFKGGTYGAAADPSVAYDAKHGEWLISTLPLAGLNGNSGLIGDVAVSRSTTGLNWGNPIIIDKTHLDDKNWTVCDNTTTSPYYGNCYTEWDQAYGTGDVLMSVSSDGGKTWGPGLASSDRAGGLGGEPLVQPNGTVIVPFAGGGIDVFSSTNGGASWGKSQAIASVNSHFVAAGLRNPNLPAASIDGAGKVFVVWSDCRFRSGCASNDIVMSSSTDGKTWSAVTRIPDRRDHQYGRSLPPRHRRRSHHVWCQRAPDDRLLLLSDRQVHDQHLQVGCGLHHFNRRRCDLDRRRENCRTDERGLAARLRQRTDGRRLHRSVLLERQSVRSLRRGASPEGHNL